ncbi:hypothetical protein D4764_07G0006540 [Takifugu flavidus]|uniref:Uncharacterized protein n=1 Tax=Takifugu flavidus TaxID=433684 RepID=A0A5C6MSX5_9TELE|nr:hypothetical protein D4764_07G0006540 [Takifugu flavidus]
MGTKGLHNISKKAILAERKWSRGHKTVHHVYNSLDELMKKRGGWQQAKISSTVPSADWAIEKRIKERGPAGIQTWLDDVSLFDYNGAQAHGYWREANLGCFYDPNSAVSLKRVKGLTASLITYSPHKHFARRCQLCCVFSRCSAGEALARGQSEHSELLAGITSGVRYRTINNEASSVRDSAKCVRSTFNGFESGALNECQRLHGNFLQQLYQRGTSSVGDHRFVHFCYRNRHCNLLRQEQFERRKKKLDERERERKKVSSQIELKRGRPVAPTRSLLSSAPCRTPRGGAGRRDTDVSAVHIYT